MKKLFLIFVVFFGISAGAMAQSFPDVAKDNPNYNAIEFLDEKEVINGYPDGSFKPEKLVNRAEAMKMIVLAMQLNSEEDLEEVFPDVLPGEWFFPHVMSAYKQGIVNGHPNGKFKPADPVNLAETLKMVTLAAGVELNQEVVDPLYSDVNADEWYSPHFEYARKNNIILPDDFGFVYPGQSMTRAHFAEVVYRMMKVKENEGKPFPLSSNWQEFNSSKVPVTLKYDSKDWKIIERHDQLVLFRPDKEFVQFSEHRTYPNSAAVTIEVDENEQKLEALQFFTNLRNAFPGATFTQFKFGNFDAMEVLVPEKRTVDWHIYLDSGQTMSIYTEYGDGILGYYLQQQIKEILKNLKYSALAVTPSPDNEALKSEIFAKVLVEGKGQEVLDKISDKIIIETDTIGVGTGPVDYYFSDSLNMTLKFERNSNVILATREGRTSAF